ncbi:MAG: hypothetical protein DSY47_02610 [Hydrogenothermus sp.]|nr:MAG: hypothetical protein DSY47_02610 [Hydrogenothermus sp.]
MIKEIFLQKIKERKEKEEHTPYIRASEIGGCPLASALRLKGFKPFIDEDKLLVFEIGNAVHLNFQSVMSDILEDVEKEIKDEQLGVSGHIDGRIGDTLIEFKSISPFALKKSRNELPYQHHIDQVHLYMYMMGLRKAIIVYIEKSSGAILEYPVEFDEERWEGLKQKIEYIKSLVEEPIEELREVSLEELKIEEWHCKYCFQKANCPAYENLKI